MRGACNVALTVVALALSSPVESSFSIVNSNGRHAVSRRGGLVGMSASPSTDEVAKTGGQGLPSSSQSALDKNLSLGAPGARPRGGHFLTRGGVQVTAHVQRLLFSNEKFEGSSGNAIEHLVQKLDSRRGVLLSSSYDFPGRYARWSLGFIDPPLEVSGKGKHCTIRALNARGSVLLPAVISALSKLEKDGVVVGMTVIEGKTVDMTVVDGDGVGTFTEEDRSRQPSLFSVVRALVDLFGYEDGDGQLGLYGAFGYDLTFQFEPITLRQARDPEQRDLVLYLPDEIVVVDQDKRDAWTISYDFYVNGKSTQGLDRADNEDAAMPFEPFDETNVEAVKSFRKRDTPKNGFAASVEKAKQEFAIGNLFEAVLSQTFCEKLNADTPPSVLFRRLRARNPSPYGFFINFGEQEYLVGASPEMFVRCEKVWDDEHHRPGVGTGSSKYRLRVETCPISGTIARGADALEDAKRVQSLIMSQKEESELTMCTDVDRNDKSRICEPGSVKVIGRRQIEMYSRLIHTVDHVEGYLREKFDALDAFLCHTWAVTVTGAPKTWAIQFLENNELSPRCWYGGAVGLIGFDGSLNTGLTLRTVRVKNGVAEVRAGATLLYDSNPLAEELETELKASAMLDAIVQKGLGDLNDGYIINSPAPELTERKVGDGKSIFLIDHEDSFVHTLGNYLRQTGAEVKTLRSGPSALAAINKLVEQGAKPDMVVLSPGPGNPSDFGLSNTIDLLARHEIPTFGVCLGLQGMVEHFGGTLGVLSYPMHGKPSLVTLTREGKSESSLFVGLPDKFEVARYHSLYGIRENMPDCLEVTAFTEDGIVMGIQHKSLPFAAVQFHPESILTSSMHGMSILQNAIRFLKCRGSTDVNGIADNGYRATPTASMENFLELAGAKPQTLAPANHMSTSQSSVIAGVEAEFKEMSVAELKSLLKSVGLGTQGTKADLILKAAYWKCTSTQVKNGFIQLESYSAPELRGMKKELRLKGTMTSKAQLLAALKECLHDD